MCQARKLVDVFIRRFSNKIFAQQAPKGHAVTSSRLDGDTTNNAGVYLDDARTQPQPDFQSLSPEIFERTFRVNVWGPLALMQACLPGMQTRGQGCIINVASGMGRCCEVAADAAAYRLSKSALLMLTRLCGASLPICPGTKPNLHRVWRPATPKVLAQPAVSTCCVSTRSAY